MDYFKKLQKQAHLMTYLTIVLAGLGIAVSWLGINLLTDNAWLVSGFMVVMTAILGFLAARSIADHLFTPLKIIQQAVLHVAPGQEAINAPDLGELRFGQELVTTLVTQIYQFASQQDGQALAEHRREVIQAANIVSHLPLPLFVFNKEQMVTNASDAALAYCQAESAQLLGHPLYETINLEFPSQHTLEAWVKDCQESKATDTAYWERVRLQLPNKELRQCDMAAYYNRDNPSGTEFIVTLFDRTAQYSQDDKDVGFVALAVHELRTPLTMLRGYIEVFEEELEGKLDPELAGYMQKMQVSARQLATFFNNIMNVARLEQNQLILKLSEGNWPEILQNTVKDLQLRAKLLGKSVDLRIAADLPTVAVDQVSVTEVINNLVENALKYSKDGGQVIIDAHLRKDGLVETTVQDFGIGIPTSVLPNLFEKFYRSHRSSAQVGGTGLGLYLSKAIVDAQGGELWVESKEGQGSTFGFTLQPYSQLAEELKNADNEGIQRGAHGWIKNHSLYRR